jgi:hypothetical protein
MRTAAEYNKWTFDFLRRRRDFVASFGADLYGEKIEPHVVWGATVAALGRIHARRMGEALTPDGACFVRGLLNLAPVYGLTTVSIPLLAHDLKWNEAARDLLREHPLVVYQRAARDSEHWTSLKDRELAAALEALRSKQSAAPVAKFFRQNRYADILYRDYRCCAVHGLDLSHKTMDAPVEGDFPPIYRNFLLGVDVAEDVPPEEQVRIRVELDDDGPPERQVRTRIMFPLGYLAELLSTMIDHEERESADTGWRIPRNATLLED